MLILSEPASGTAAKNGRDKEDGEEAGCIINGTTTPLGNITCHPISPENPELGEEPCGIRAVRKDIPFPAYAMATHFPYLLLLLLRDQVGVAVHSLLRLILVPAALLVQTLGLGQTPQQPDADTPRGEALGKSSACK